MDQLSLVFFERRAAQRTWVAFLRRHVTAELAAALSMLFIYVGVRRPKVKEAVEQAMDQVKQIPRVIKSASRDGVASMIRSASDHGFEALGQASEMVRSASRDSFRRAFGSSRRKNAEDSDVDASTRASSVSSLLSEVAEPGDAGQISKAVTKKSATQRFADYMVKHMDQILLGSISYKAVLLLLFLMPQSYFYGVKRKVLQWASKARVFRMYLRIAPLALAAVTGSAAIAARFSRKASRSTISGWQTKSILNVLLTYSSLRLFELIRGDPEPMLQLEKNAEQRDMLNYEPPSVNTVKTLVAPLKKLAPDVWLGIENLPKPVAPDTVPKRILFVGNHMLWAADGLHFVSGLYQNTGIYVRPLGEHAWWTIPGLGEAVSWLGAVDGTRANCGLLMEKGENLLVYPGGLREAWKSKADEPNSLIWGDHHLGFARMAVRHGYTIVPVATVGMEDIIGSGYDVNVKQLTTLGGLLPNVGKGMSKAFDVDAMPVPWKVGDLQRIYYHIGTPISTADVVGQEANEDILRSIRDRTKESLQQQVQYLLSHREKDPERYTFASNAGTKQLVSRL